MATLGHKQGVQAESTITREILSWRVALLSDAGFSDGLAEQLARDRGYDLHALLELVDQGCPPRFAVRILAPLYCDGRPG
jgi:hypothetical protein